MTSERASARYIQATNGKSVKVTLVYLTTVRDETKVDEPLSISTLGGALRKAFNDLVDVSLVHYLAENGVEGIIERIQNEKPDILGLSLSFDSLNKLDQIMTYINSLPEQEQPLIVLGNILAKHNSEMLLKKYSQVLICTAEGEDTIQDIVRYFKGEIEKSKIVNVRYFDEFGKIRINPFKRVDFINTAIPQRDILPHTIRTGGIVHFETSRGCPYNCSICCRKSFLDCDAQCKAGWQGRKIDDVIRDIVDLSKRGARFMNIVDEDLFAGGADRVIEIAERIIALKKAGEIAKDLYFFTSASVRSIYKEKDTAENNAKKVESLKKLKEAGLNNFFMGIESGSPTQLKRYGKAASVAENEEAIRIVKGLGIRCVPGFIMFDAEVTITELIENIAFLKRTGSYGTITYPLKCYLPMAGSRLARRFMEKGLVSKNIYDADHTFFEFVYEHLDVAQIMARIKRWEESQSRFPWQFKVIFRSSRLAEVSQAERSFFMTAMDEQTMIILGYIEELIESSSEEERIQIDTKYRDRLINDMIAILRGFDDGSFSLDKKIFKKIIYQGIIREIVRTEFCGCAFTVDDIAAIIINIFSYQLDLKRLKQEVENFINDGRLRFVDNRMLAIADGFWQYRQLTFNDLPRPAKDDLRDSSEIDCVTSRTALLRNLGSLPKNENQDDFVPLLEQFVLLNATKGDSCDESIIQINEYLVPNPFVSQILGKIRMAEPLKVFPGKDSLKRIDRLYPLARQALETHDIEIFLAIIDLITQSDLIDPQQKKELLFTFFTWSNASVLPHGNKFHSYSFESFLNIVKSYRDNYSNNFLIQIAQLGSGDGVAHYLDRKLLEALGIKNQFTLFDVDKASLEKSKRYNPNCDHIQCDLCNMNPALVNKFLDKFDFIYANNVLHEIYGRNGQKGVHTILCMAYRFLKPGGRLILRDGICLRDKKNLLVLKAKTKEGEQALGQFFRNIPDFSYSSAGNSNGPILLTYKEAVNFLTTAKYLFGGNNKRYPSENELQQVYCFATWEEYVEYFRQAKFVIETVSAGTESSILDLWRSNFSLQSVSGKF